MSEPIQVAAYEGGQLRLLSSGASVREVVLALPLNRLIVKMVKVPPGEDPVAVATPILQALSPFADEPLTVSCETVRETEAGTVVLAAAMPEGAADEVAEALDQQKLQVTRIDALIVGLLRGLWSQLGEGNGRRLLVVRSLSGIALVVLDGDQPAAIRSISAAADAVEWRREVMLLLLDAEDFVGSSLTLDETVVVSVGDAEGLPELPAGVLETYGAVREVAVGADAALVGVAERASDPASLNALPESWSQMLDESRFKRKLYSYLALAGGVWILIMATLFGVPMVYGLMTGHQKELSKQHSRQHRAVLRMKEKVELVQKYSDHAQGALEVMKKISDSLEDPEVTLTSWSFKRNDTLRFSGEAATAKQVYDLKNRLDQLFESVELVGPSTLKGGQQKFDIVVSFVAPEVES